MSEYVHWLNLIKERANAKWLTDSQRKSVDELEAVWTIERCAVLLGDAGTGKSFIGRLISQSTNGLYVSGLSAVAECDCSGKCVVLDLGCDEVYTRGLRLMIEEKGMGRLLVLTRHEPRDLVRTVKLHLTEHDVQQFRHNMFAYDILEAFCTEPAGIDLAEDLRREAINRASPLTVSPTHEDGKAAATSGTHSELEGESHGI